VAAGVALSVAVDVQAPDQHGAPAPAPSRFRCARSAPRHSMSRGSPDVHRRVCRANRLSPPLARVTARGRRGSPPRISAAWVLQRGLWPVSTNRTTDVETSRLNASAQAGRKN
jgi:hypothetical protein